MCVTRSKNRSLALRSGFLFASTQKVHRPRAQFPLQFEIGTYSKFAWKNNFLPSDVYFPQPCSVERWLQICRVKITFTVLPTNCFVSTTKSSIKCTVNWIPLRICVYSRNIRLYLNGESWRATAYRWV